MYTGDTHTHHLPDGHQAVFAGGKELQYIARKLQETYEEWGVCRERLEDQILVPRKWLDQPFMKTSQKKIEGSDEYKQTFRCNFL